MRKGRAPEVRSLIRKTTAKLLRKGTTAEEIAIACEKEHEKAFITEAPDLRRIATIKLASDELSRARKQKPASQFELFEEYDIREFISLRVSDAKGSRYVHKSIRAASIAEIKQVIAEHSKLKEVRQDDLDGLRKIVADSERLGVPEDVTVDAFWSKAQAAKGKRKASPRR